MFGSRFIGLALFAFVAGAIALPLTADQPNDSSAAANSLTAARPLNATTAGDNWPQWRGAKLDSHSAETGLPVEFGKEQNLLWRVELPGPGGSSPVVWEKQVFVTTAAGDKLELLAFDLSGKQLWSAPLDGENRKLRMDSANYAAPSPLTDGEHVWATSSAGVLHCFTMSGQQVWKVDLQEKYGAFDIQFGMASTPVLDNGRLYHQLLHGNMQDDSPGVGIVVCLDAKSGAQIWRHDRASRATFENKHSYCSPIIYRDQQREYLIVHGGDVATAHSLTDGSEIWRVGGLNPAASYNNYLRFVSSPGCAEGMIVVPSAKGGPVLCLRPDMQGDLTEQAEAYLWKMDRGTPDVASPVIHEGLVYLCIENGLVTCVDAKTGKEHYKERLLADQHRSTPVIADGKLYITGRKGKVLVMATGTEPKVLAENDLDEVTTASPAISNGKIFVRTFEALYCFGDQAKSN
jgi:outer membrane protein assembly factor BamB